MNDETRSSDETERSTSAGWTTAADVDRLKALRGAAEASSIDLHSHSRHSDGDWTPPDLLADAGRLGLNLLSLTDHDTVEGQPAARLAAAEHGLLALAGMEVSLTVEGRLYHVLAYDFDPASPTWARFVELRQARRERFTLALFEQLSARGYAASPDLARDESGRFVPNALGVALHRAGLAPSAEAGRTLLRNLGISYPAEASYLDVAEFADLLRPGEAVFSVAHPARHQAGVSVRLSEDDLRAFRAQIPLAALEAYHPYHSSADVEHYRQLASRHDLAVTCGSDAHGQRHGRPLRRHSATLADDFLGLIQDRWEARVAGSLSSGEREPGDRAPSLPLVEPRHPQREHRKDAVAQPQHARDFFAAYLWPQRQRVAILTTLLLASTGLQLVNPQILRVFIDRATAGAPLGDLARLAGLFIAVAVVRQGTAIAETSVAENLGQVTTNELRADLTRHSLALDLGFHQLHPPGELIERVDGDVGNLANFFSRFVIQIGGNGLLLIGVLVLLFGVTISVGAAVGLSTLAALAVLARLRDAGVPSWIEERQARAELFGFLEERLGGTEDLRALGAVEHTLRRLAERSRRLYHAVQRRALVGSATGSAASLALALVTAAGLGLAATAFLRGEVTIGSVYLVYAYTQLLGRPLEQMARQIQDFQRAAASLGRIRDLLATTSRLVENGTATLPRGPLAVKLRDVTFGYAPDEPVLRDVSLAIRPGEVIGLLGRTGSGKTTLARLVARFYDPDQGSVQIGGVDARAAHPADLRRAVSVVTQDVHLFHASVRDNLTLFDETITDERLVEVLRELGLWNWCQSLPGGLDAPLAAGTSLSAGEAQLLAFARVFLRDPGVVVLDEASSRLDPATERQVEQALDRVLVGRTAIVIAHRLATVERAETIVILEDGEIRERGPREGLARDPSSLFAQLRRVGLEEVLA